MVSSGTSSRLPTVPFAFGRARPAGGAFAVTATHAERAESGTARDAGGNGGPARARGPRVSRGGGGRRGGGRARVPGAPVTWDAA